MSNATVTCGNCRHEFAATALFCPHCGRAKVRDDGDVLLGKILGERFLVQERLGQGASGTIYRAEHVTLRRKVAIKVLHHELVRDDLALERFRREATTVADIDNDHIVEIHDFGRTPDGRLYLAMELLEGETLDAVLAREGKLPVDRVVDVMTQVGDALIEAHAIGYIHRDIRPRNIFLQARRGKPNFVKILDFGLAKAVESEGQAASTSLGMTFGDPRYMSPEQARGDAIDRRADVYQLGCVAYEMLTGGPPFMGGRVFDVLARHVNEAPQPVGRLRDDVPKWLEAAVMTMLAKQPADRFATLSRMVEALRIGAANGTIMPVDTARRTETEPPPSVSRVMQKLGRTALGPHGDDDTVPVQAIQEKPAAKAAVPEEVTDNTRTQELHRVGPRGTPKVGVPVVPASAAPTQALPPTPPGAEPPSPDPASPRGGVWQRPALSTAPAGRGGEAAAAETRADGIAGGVNPATIPGSAPMPGPASGKQGGASTGKLPRSKRGSAGESAGISSVWYADGDKLDGGAELDDSQLAKLDKARRLISLDAGSSLSDGYAPSRPPIGKIAAVAGAALLLVIVLAVIVSGGGGDGGQQSAKAKTPEPVAVDAAPIAMAPDAGVAPPDAAVAPVKKDPVKKTGGGKKDPDDSGGGKDPVDPLDNLNNDDRGKITPDEESKAKAEFFAKAGEGQLRNGDSQGAAANFKKALELDPKNVAAIVGLGEVAMQQGLYDAAIKHLKKAVKLAKGSSRIHTLLGECYLNSGNTKSAEASFKKALQLDPDNSRAREGYNEASSRLPPPADDP